MYCLRCGKDTADGKVFCKGCLESMEEYPVKPGIPIVLPSRPTVAPQKKSRRTKPMNNEELLDSLRYQLKWMGRLLLITTGLLIVAIVLLFLQCQYNFLPQI